MVPCDSSTTVPQNVFQIEKLVYGGDGLARLDGQVVLTPFVLPDEEIRAELIRAKNDLLRGDVLEVLRPSPARIDPPCPYFYRCGGCQYQHATYEYQLEQKQAIFREVLQRVGKIELENAPEVIAAEPWQYRNRTQLHIIDGAIGYFEAASHRLCAIDHCPISSPRLNDAIRSLSEVVPKLRGFEATIELFTNETEMQVNVIDRVPRSAWFALEQLGTQEPIEYLGLRVSRNSFFQVNRFLIEQLVTAATDGYSGEDAVDLYAGVGLFAARLAKAFRKVDAVESGTSAFGDLEWNAQAHPQIITHSDSAEQYLSALDGTPDLILADPPRTGLGKTVVSELAGIRAPRLSLVSCDPATLARDLRALFATGYAIEKITLVDLFPQTFHMESVVRLALV